MATDDPYWNELREDAEAYRAQTWEFREFRSGPALFTRDGRIARAYEGEPFDPAEWEIREGGWDHEHCHFCMAKLTDAPDAAALKAGYISGRVWLCPKCYRRIVEGGEDPEAVIMERAEPSE